MNMTENTAWQPSAAYLYVLHLDAPRLAWEYLRRNPAYRAQWPHHGTVAGAAQHWGLSFPRRSLPRRARGPARLAPRCPARPRPMSPYHSSLPGVTPLGPNRTTLDSS